MTVENRRLLVTFLLNTVVSRNHIRIRVYLLPQMTDEKYCMFCKEFCVLKPQFILVKMYVYLYQYLHEILCKENNVQVQPYWNFAIYTYLHFCTYV